MKKKLANQEEQLTKMDEAILRRMHAKSASSQSHYTFHSTQQQASPFDRLKSPKNKDDKSKEDEEEFKLNTNSPSPNRRSYERQTFSSQKKRSQLPEYYKPR